MGKYYQIACDELGERIDPGNINDLGMKSRNIAHRLHPFGAIVVFALLSRWADKTIRLINDSDDGQEYYDYLEVTEIILREYNEFYKTDYKFTEKKL